MGLCRNVEAFPWYDTSVLQSSGPRFFYSFIFHFKAEEAWCGVKV